jgi:hypothetical protein
LPPTCPRPKTQLWNPYALPTVPMLPRCWIWANCAAASWSGSRLLTGCSTATRSSPWLKRRSWLRRDPCRGARSGLDSACRRAPGDPVPSADQRARAGELGGSDTPLPSEPRAAHLGKALEFLGTTIAATRTNLGRSALGPTESYFHSNGTSHGRSDAKLAT